MSQRTDLVDPEWEQHWLARATEMRSKASQLHLKVNEVQSGPSIVDLQTSGEGIWNFEYVSLLFGKTYFKFKGTRLP